MKIYPEMAFYIGGNKCGGMFERWEDHGDEQVIRLVTNWSSTQQDIEDFLALI